MADNPFLTVFGVLCAAPAFFFFLGFVAGRMSRRYQFVRVDQADNSARFARGAAPAVPAQRGQAGAGSLVNRVKQGSGAGVE